MNQELESILTALQRNSMDITASSIVAVDGIPVCYVLQKGTDPDRVGSVSAAMLALGTRAAKELASGKMKQLIIEGHDGHIVLLQAGEQHVLVLTARANAKLGMVLVLARHTVEQIKKQLD